MQRDTGPKGLFPDLIESEATDDERVGLAHLDNATGVLESDPQNLRRPALRMLVGLLQPGTKAGV